MSIPQSDIDHILRMEGNADYARMKIATEFSKEYRSYGCQESCKPC